MAARAEVAPRVDSTGGAWRNENHVPTRERSIFSVGCDRGLSYPGLYTCLESLNSFPLQEGDCNGKRK